MKRVNAICVKTKNEWFHVACSWYGLFHLVDFVNLLSRNMLIGADSDGHHNG